MATNYIKIETVTLSDGSKVYDVIVPAMRLHAATEKDAWNLLDKIYNAASSHTVDTVEMA